MTLTLLTLLRHWWRAPLQLALLITGLALATALWSAVQAINGEARASYARAVAQIGSSTLPALTAPDRRIPLGTYVQLRRHGWQLSPVLEGSWQVGGRAVTLMGVDVLSHPVAPALGSAVDSTGEAPLSALQPPGLLFAHPDTLSALAHSAHPMVSLPHLPPDVVIGDLSLVADLLNQPDSLSRLLVLPEQPAGLTPLADLAPQLEITGAQAGALGDPERLTRSFHLNLTAFGLLSFAVGLFIVQGSVTLGIEQRRGAIRTLRCLGVPLYRLMLALLLELLALALTAGLIGLVIGYGLAALLLPDVSATLRGLYGAPVEGSLSLRPGWVLSGLAMATAGTVLAGAQAFVALHRMARDLSQSSHVLSRSSPTHWRLLAATGGLLILLGWGVMAVAPGLLSGFVWLGGLMLGAALLLPPMLHGLLRLIPRPGQTGLLTWLIADSRLQLPGLSLSLMALLLAVATNIGVGTMVSSFRLTFLDWIDQRLVADVYVSAGDAELNGAILAWARQQDGLRALPRYRSTSRIAAAPLRIHGIVDDARYRETWPMLRAAADPWDRVFHDAGVLINEQLAHRTGLEPGDVLQLAPGWRARIAGVYADYGNPDGQAFVATGDLQRHRPDAALSRIGLVPPDGVSPREVIRRLRQAIVLPPDAVLQREAIKATSIRVFERTFVVTGALNILTLAVAAFAMLTSFLSQWSRRLPQWAPLWAMGVTRRQLALCELLRSLAFAVMTFAAALPLGLLLAWILLAHINLEAFGWQLPMSLFPSDWLRLFVLTCAAAIMAALWPVLRLLRLDPAALLGVFSNER